MLGKFNSLKIQLLAILFIAASGHSDSTIDERINREIRFVGAKGWPVWLPVPVKAVTECFKRPTKIKWSLTDENTLLLTFNTYDAISEQSFKYKIAFSSLYVQGEKRFIELATRILINNEELDEYERLALASKIRDNSLGLQQKYAKWHAMILKTSTMQSTIESSATDLHNQSADGSDSAVYVDFSTLNSENTNSSTNP